MQGRHKRERESRLKIQLRVSANNPRLEIKDLAVTTLELNWYDRFGDRKEKLKVFRQELMSSTQLQNRSFHVRLVDRTRTAAKLSNFKNVQKYCFSSSNMQICDVLAAFVALVA